MEESSGDNPINVVAWRYPEGGGLENTSSDTQREHGNSGDRPVRIAVEVGDPQLKKKSASPPIGVVFRSRSHGSYLSSCKNQHTKMFPWWFLIIIKSRFCLASDSAS